MEKMEIENIKYNLTSKFNSILELPAIAEVVTLVTGIPFAGELVKYLSGYAATENREKLINDILKSEEPLRPEVVKKLDFLAEFLQLMDCAAKVRSQEKLDYIGKLFRNSIYLSNTPDYDFYEECKSKLLELSEREIDILFFLDEEIPIPPTVELAATSIKNDYIWNAYLHLASAKFDIGEEDIASIVAGISRTGFCRPKITIDKGKYNVAYEVTPLFKKLKEYI